MNTKVLSVISLLEGDEALANDLRNAAWAIALYVTLAGLTIYTSLFLLFYGSYHRQKATTERLRQSQDSIILAMPSLSSLRDQETGGHFERCSACVSLLATKLRADKAFRSFFRSEYVRALSNVVLLHYIGKVGMALVDVYDAIHSERYHKNAMSHEEAMRILWEGAGNQFDPKIIAVLIASQGEFKRILHGRFQA